MNKAFSFDISQNSAKRSFHGSVPCLWYFSKHILHSSFSHAFNTKLPEMAILTSKDLTVTKILHPFGVNVMSTLSGDYYWFESLSLSLLIIRLSPTVGNFFAARLLVLKHLHTYLIPWCIQYLQRCHRMKLILIKVRNLYHVY